MSAVTSINGKITEGTKVGTGSWISNEDQDHLSKLVAKHNLIVFGRKTYEKIRPNIKLHPAKLRVVLTSNPSQYKNDSKKGVLEFTNESPKELVLRLEKEGFKSMLLLGGGFTYTSFLRDDLVSEIYLTIEPQIFTQGINLFSDELVKKRLRLLDHKLLNKQGTILVHYKVGL
ncbi:MAG TPA: dihydrofolate reductase family protein [Candidatus Sulfotelmatobacter sp.]|nr:dihydrofolate reductase family protein [Candidatus Sulfotelmatobacter sp.]